jgi:hypothetical protein
MVFHVNASECHLGANNNQRVVNIDRMDVDGRQAKREIARASGRERRVTSPWRMTLVRIYPQTCLNPGHTRSSTYCDSYSVRLLEQNRRNCRDRNKVRDYVF